VVFASIKVTQAAGTFDAYHLGSSEQKESWRHSKILSRTTILNMLLEIPQKKAYCGLIKT
jgi:hypothetical protein